MLVIVHYAEIALKGGNRQMFEEKLVANIQKSLTKQGIVFDSIKRIYGRILIELPGTIPGEVYGGSSPVSLALKNIFGIAHFSLVEKCAKDIEKIKEKALEVLSKKDFVSFKVETKRGDKTFPLTSQQISEQVGEAVMNGLSKKVDLHNPDVILYIEITEKDAFLYTE
ncbi:MAG: THUMP domain-containing protein, partial [Patescibacteria group bacterium]